MGLTDYRTVGVIGLGVMGYPMASNLAQKLPDATKLVVYDVNAEAMERFSAQFPGKAVKGKHAQDVFSQSVSPLQRCLS